MDGQDQKQRNIDITSTSRGWCRLKQFAARLVSCLLLGQTQHVTRRPHMIWFGAGLGYVCRAKDFTWFHTESLLVASIRLLKRSELVGWDHHPKGPRTLRTLGWMQNKICLESPVKQTLGSNRLWSHPHMTQTQLPHVPRCPGKEILQEGSARSLGLSGA